MSFAADRADEIKSQLNGAWLPQLYRDRVMTVRTRAFELGSIPRNARVEVQHTLLGVELQVGRRRLLCPDLATARYLSVLARGGCEKVAIPYDITQISYIADELESSWQRMLLLVDHGVAGQSDAMRARIRRLLIAKLSGEIDAAGAGPSVPEFKQSTRYRRAT